MSTKICRGGRQRYSLPFGEFSGRVLICTVGKGGELSVTAIRVQGPCIVDPTPGEVIAGELYD